MKALRISDTLSLPLDTVTDTVGVLAVKGAGKSFTSMVFVEELAKHRLPVVALDPVGVFFGLRSSADGKGPGLPVVILGGRHADVPIEEGAGRAIADFVMAERQPTVIDFSEFPTRASMIRFALDFFTRLYQGNRDPLHVVIDEADDFAPQKPLGEETRLLHAVEVLVRRGRAKGLGCTLITQRPAVLNKNVLTQIGTLVVGRMTSPQDRKAVEAWVDGHATGDQKTRFMSSLASLPNEEKWIWSPQAGIFSRVTIRARETLDSSATPKIGAVRVEPKALAAVDSAGLKARIAATIEKAKAEDPRELKKRIAELEKQVKASRTPASESTCVVCRKSSPGGTGAWATHPSLDTTPVHRGPCFQKYEAQKPTVPAVSTDVLEVLCRQADALAASAEIIRVSCERVAARSRPETRSEPRVDGPRWPPLVELFHRPVLPEPAKALRGAVVSSSRSSAALGRCGRALLDVLAQRDPMATSRAQLAILSGYSSTSSSFSNALGTLRSGGLARGAGDSNYITEEGRAVAGDVTPLPGGSDLVRYWQNKLGKCEATLLGILVAAHPKDVSKDSLAEASGYSATSSSFSNALGRLRTLELVNGFRASDALMGGGYE